VKITAEDVRYVADLAHLRLSEPEVQKMVREMDAILTHMEKLNELDTRDVPPMAQVLFDAEETATLRADLERPSLTNQEALASAPNSGAGFFKVPRVIER
jgi:aspartyl-tRNA(Asn)/glutamyl-tRNA(Gln) amidotransferase subunit C